MKKVLLSLIALLGISTYALADEVTTTDVSGYDYVIYAENINAVSGMTVNLPIYMKNAENVASIQFNIVLPGDLADTYKKNGLNSERYNEDNGGTIYDANKQADGSVMVIATVLHDDGFNAGDSPICYISLPISNTLPSGEYPIVVKATAFSGVGGVGSKIVEINENIISKLVVEDFLTLDENSTSLPTAYEGNVLVKRTIKANEWSTLCLPFDMTAEQVDEIFGGNTKFALFDSYTKDGGNASTSIKKDAQSIEINFESYDWTEDGIFANVPYLINSQNDIKEFKFAEISVMPDEDEANMQYKRSGRVVGTYYGTLHAGDYVPENGLFLNGGNFYYSTGKTKIKAFRGYFVLNDILADMDANVKMQVIVDGTTAIDNVRLADSEGAVYTVDGKFIGRDVDQKKLQKGLYIIDGKKVAIK